MDLMLAGKRALVTGGTKGIGRAAARALAKEGVHVVIAARSEDQVSSVAHELSDSGGMQVHGVVVNTAYDASADAAVARCVELLGGLDILVNAAAMPGGQSDPPKLAEITDSLFWDDVNVKVMGYLRMARAAAPHMALNGWGRIVCVGGLAARQSGTIIGSMRNVAVAAMAKNLADELGPKGINVTVIHPGITRTERTGPRVADIAREMGISAEDVERSFAAGNSIGRLIDASEVADIVTFLASPRSVAITGDAIACGGGAKGSIHY